MASLLELCKSCVDFARRGLIVVLVYHKEFLK